MKIKKKILIVGCGKMGIAHLTSFFKGKTKYSITVIDKQRIINKLKKKYSYSNLKFQDKLPKKSSFDLALIATNSKERFLVSNKIVKNNEVKKILLEKFVFLEKQDYFKFDRLIKAKKINCYVNCWGSTLSRLLNFPEMINKTSTINVSINNGSYLTNLIHILNLIFDGIGFREATNYKLILHKVLKSKIKNYHEIYAKLSLNTKNKNIYVNIFSKKIKNVFQIEIINKKKSIIYLNKNLKIIKKHNGKITKFSFPLSSIFTEKIYQNIDDEKYLYKFIDFKYAKEISLLILNLISKTSKFNLSIR
jgi:hypothetical protein